MMGEYITICEDRLKHKAAQLREGLSAKDVLNIKNNLLVFRLPYWSHHKTKLIW